MRILFLGDVVGSATVDLIRQVLPGLIERERLDLVIANAENAAGGEKLYQGVVPVTILKVVGIELASLGRVEAAGPHEESIVHEDPAAGRYRKLVIADGRIVGAILLGQGNDVAAVRTAITRGFDVTSQLENLRRGRWDQLAQLSGGRPLVPAATT